MSKVDITAKSGNSTFSTMSTDTTEDRIHTSVNNAVDASRGGINAGYDPAFNPNVKQLYMVQQSNAYGNFQSSSHHYRRRGVRDNFANREKGRTNLDRRQQNPHDLHKSSHHYGLANNRQDDDFSDMQRAQTASYQNNNQQRKRMNRQDHQIEAHSRNAPYGYDSGERMNTGSGRRPRQQQTGQRQSTQQHYKQRHNSQPHNAVPPVPSQYQQPFIPNPDFQYCYQNTETKSNFPAQQIDAWLNHRATKMMKQLQLPESPVSQEKNKNCDEATLYSSYNDESSSVLGQKSSTLNQTGTEQMIYQQATYDPSARLAPEDYFAQWGVKQPMPYLAPNDLYPFSPSMYTPTTSGTYPANPGCWTQPNYNYVAPQHFTKDDGESHDPTTFQPVNQSYQNSSPYNFYMVPPMQQEQQQQQMMILVPPSGAAAAAKPYPIESLNASADMPKDVSHVVYST